MARLRNFLKRSAPVGGRFFGCRWRSREGKIGAGRQFRGL